MAINNKSYSNLIDTLKNLGKAHQQISTTTTGDIYDIDLDKNTKYILMHINNGSVTTGRVGLTYNFRIFIMNIVENDSSNEQEVYNETLAICVDIISIFRNSQWQSQVTLDINTPVYFTEGEYTLEPFKERFDQSVCGWTFEIGINVENNFQTCLIPMNDNVIGQ